MADGLLDELTQWMPCHPSTASLISTLFIHLLHHPLTHSLYTHTLKLASHLQRDNNLPITFQFISLTNDSVIVSVIREGEERMGRLREASSSLPLHDCSNSNSTLTSITHTHNQRAHSAMAGWQSSNLVIRSETAPGMETCLLCREEDLSRLAEARQAMERGEEGAAELVNEIQKRCGWWNSSFFALSIPPMLTVSVMRCFHLSIA